MSDFPSLRLADYGLEWTTPEKCGLAATCADCGSHRIEHPAVCPCTPTRHLCNIKGWEFVPNNADVRSRQSLDIASWMFELLDIRRSQPWQARQHGAARFEAAAAHFAAADGLTVRRNARLSEFAQYRHLHGRKDDRLRLDITVSLDGALLAVLELKTIIRNDRGRGAIQNLTGTLRKHSGGRPPVAAVLTAEPLPSRLASAVPQQGDTHEVYHVAREALDGAIGNMHGTQYAEWQSVKAHVRDFSELMPSLRGAA